MNPNNLLDDDHKFPLGTRVMTAGLLGQLNLEDYDALDGILARHQRGDWGHLNPDDKAANDQAVTTGERILSAYHLPSGIEVWAILVTVTYSCLLYGGTGGLC